MHDGQLKLFLLINATLQMYLQLLYLQKKINNNFRKMKVMSKIVGTKQAKNVRAVFVFKNKLDIVSPNLKVCE